MLNWSLRYLPVVELLDLEEATNVLDVGSGWHGLSTYRRGLTVQTDLHFAGLRPVGPTAGRPAYVAADATGLPFRDRAFDFVVSLDLVEHLPVESRTAAISELTRVAARGVIIGFPYGPRAAVTDRRLAALLTRIGQGTPPWLQEHLDQPRYPDADLMASAMPAGWRVASDRGLGNSTLTLAVVLAEHLPLVHRLAGAVDSWYRRRGPIRFIDRGQTYRRLWVLTPNRNQQ